MNNLFLHGRRWWLLNPTLPLLPCLRNALTHSRYFRAKEEDTSQGIGEKARSTAEEFSRQAKEKSETISESAKEVWEDAKEAVIGETESDKEKFKEKVEKGNYDKISRD